MRPLLYLICVLTDFSAFVVIFAVSRGLAEGQAAPWYLGLVGAGLSFSAGVGSILGGWLAQFAGGRRVFLAGAGLMSLSILACWLGDPLHLWFLPGYWLLGIGLGCLYPPLIGWLNQGEDAHSNHRGVSRTLIIYCIAWNLGMLSGQLTAGSLYGLGVRWIYLFAMLVSLANCIVAVIAARCVWSLPSTQTHITSGPLLLIERATQFKRLGWIANLGGMFGGSMILHLLPDLAVSIGVPADQHGRLLACWRIVIIATYLLMHTVTFWHYRFSTSVISQFLAAGGLLVVASADSAATLLAGLVLLGQLVGYNYFSGLFYSTAGSSQQGRALAAGIHEATLAAGMAAGTIIGGVLATVDKRLPYVLAAVFLLVLIAVQTVAWIRWIVPLQRVVSVADDVRLQR